MYFLRLRLRPDSNPARQLRQSEYRIHQVLRKLFAEHADDTRCFVFRHLEPEQPDLFYAVSSKLPTQEDSIWQVDAKDYNPDVKKGQQLIFSLRANPVRNTRDSQNSHKRHDIVMDAKIRYRNTEEPLPPRGLLVREAGLEWICAKQDQLGLEIDPTTLAVDGYRTRTFAKTKSPKAAPIRIATLDFSGYATVTDPEQLTTVLFNGFGPAKGFGCGMLMVRPA